MPELERPDGARIHYEVRGEGPLVVLSLGFAATPATYEGLVADLARDHRVLTWEPRGCGSSSADGPFDIPTDADDLLALVHEVGPPAVGYAAGHGVNVTVSAMAVDGDAISVLVTPGIVTALREHLEGTEGFAASETVTELLVGQLRRDPRAAVRATVGSLNPQLDEDALRARVDETLAYTSPETTLERIECWLTQESPLDDLRALGDRLAIVWHEGDSWQSGAIGRARELLPEARVIEVEDGPLSRPDLQANVVREME
ncbi:MAG: alpha/beta fold hydrolase [Thermoleophilaceae bacterium]